MSLIMPIMINDTTIGELVVTRLAALKDGGSHTYKWCLKMKDTPDLRGNTHGDIQYGDIDHKYDDGAVVLIKKIMEQVKV